MKHTTIYYGFSEYQKPTPRFTPREINDFWLGLGFVTGLVAFMVMYF